MLLSAFTLFTGSRWFGIFAAGNLKSARRSEVGRIRVSRTSVVIRNGSTEGIRNSSKIVLVVIGSLQCNAWEEVPEPRERSEALFSPR